MTVPPLRELVHTMLLTVQEADVIRDLRANEVVVVACPPGGRVVVDRTPQPCETCGGIGGTSGVIPYEYAKWKTPCKACGGSGVVEATTTYGLEPADPFEVFTASDGIPSIRGRSDLFAAVALPEETPQ